jgi:hypothetical protein
MNAKEQAAVVIVVIADLRFIALCQVSNDFLLHGCTVSLNSLKVKVV